MHLLTSYCHIVIVRSIGTDVVTVKCHVLELVYDGTLRTSCTSNSGVAFEMWAMFTSHADPVYV